jgi:thioesterase domain-containing protein
LDKNVTRSSDFRAAEEFFHQQIPLTRAMGVRVIGDDEAGFRVAAPVALNYNHLHTAFGGSINAVATLAGYGLLWMELRGTSAQLLIAGSSIRFLRPLRETITATCARLETEELAGFHATLRETGKSRITLRVRVEENGQTAAEFEATFVALADFQA